MMVKESRDFYEYQTSKTAGMNELHQLPQLEIKRMFSLDMPKK